MDDDDERTPRASRIRVAMGAAGDATEILPRAGAAMPPSVNYHLWAACNMRCRFCFAVFDDVVGTVAPRGHLPREESVRLDLSYVDNWTLAGDFVIMLRTARAALLPGRTTA